MKYEVLSARFAVEAWSFPTRQSTPGSGTYPNKKPEQSGQRPDPGGTHAVVKAVLSMAEDAEQRERPDFTDRQEWAQLCCVALADTDLLPSSLRGAITSGDTVSPRVRDAYFLAKYKVFNYRMSSGGVRGF